ncbi:MAG TPA: N-acetyltransferase [Crenotrichaceae bacterium]|nr:N-acetyltransferase [Crenotrichaceae bacterium]
MTPPKHDPIKITPVTTRQLRSTFIHLPRFIFKNDRQWVSPISLERRIHLSRYNPYFSHAIWNSWVAFSNDQAVGRISAQIDQLYLDQYPDKTGFFGFFDAIDNPHVAKQLLTTAEQWLTQQGMNYVRGPFSLSINDESGLLVNGFDTSPSFMMGHALPYYQNHLLENDYKSVKDLLVYKLASQFQIPRNMQLLLSKATDSITVRPLRSKQLASEFRILREIFNDAWSDNWGFVPFTEDEFDEMGKQLKYIVDDDFVQIAELDGQPIGMIVMLPNLNEIIADLDGKLFPTGWFKLIWRLKTHAMKTGRVALMGVRKEYQNNIIAAAASFMLINSLREPARRWGIEEVELSWILEDNIRMRNILETIGCTIYKTYRIYEKQLISIET